MTTIGFSASRAMTLATRAGICFLVASVAACATGATSSVPVATGTSRIPTGTPSVGPTSTPSPSVGNDLIGRWERDQTCLQLVQAYRAAGLESFIAGSLVGIGFTAGQVDLDEPCEGAIGVHRSQVFAAEGSYAGLDPTGSQVDGGQFRITAPGVLDISDGEESTTFAYTVDRDSLTFEVIWPTPCSTFECLDHMAWATETFTLGPWVRTAP